MERNYRQEVEDMRRALQSAIAHSGSGEQRQRWESLLPRMDEIDKDLTQRELAEAAAKVSRANPGAY